MRHERALEHLRAVVDAVSLPVKADFEGGYALDPEHVGAHVKRAVATGIAGLSIEDSTGDEADPLFSFELAVERVRAARAAIDEPGKGVVLTGRSETLARVAWLSFRQAAQEIPDAGTFTHFNDLPNPDALFEQR